MFAKQSESFLSRGELNFQTIGSRDDDIQMTIPPMVTIDAQRTVTGSQYMLFSTSSTQPLGQLFVGCCYFWILNSVPTYFFPTQNLLLHHLNTTMNNVIVKTVQVTLPGFRFALDKVLKVPMREKNMYTVNAPSRDELIPNLGVKWDQKQIRLNRVKMGELWCQQKCDTMTSQTTPPWCIKKCTSWWGFSAGWRANLDSHRI